MQTRDQKYAVDIYKRVLEVKKFAEADRNRYGAMAHQLPILIRTAGLAQALAFLDSRDTEGHKQLLIDLAATIGQPGQLLPGKLLQRARGEKGEGIGDYMLLTRQVMAALLWYKRFAQSVLDIKASDVVKDANLAPVPDVKANSAEGKEK